MSESLRQVGNCGIKEDNQKNPTQEWIPKLQCKKKFHFCTRKNLQARLKYPKDNLDGESASRLSDKVHPSVRYDEARARALWP